MQAGHITSPNTSSTFLAEFQAVVFLPTRTTSLVQWCLMVASYKPTHRATSSSVTSYQRVPTALGVILTRSDRSIDSKVTSFGHKEHRSHISALGASNTLGPPVEWHSRALLDHCQALAAHALLHHISIRARRTIPSRTLIIVCRHDLQRLSRTKVTS